MEVGNILLTSGYALYTRWHPFYFIPQSTMASVYMYCALNIFKIENNMVLFVIRMREFHYINMYKIIDGYIYL